MSPKAIWANFAVENLERTTKFYKQLGFKPNGSSKDLTSFLFGTNDFVIHFFLKDVLKANLKSEIADLRYGSEIVFTLSAASKEEVNVWQKEVEKAGGTIITPAEEFGPGYYGFLFDDPDGHKFNVFYMGKSV